MKNIEKIPFNTHDSWAIWNVPAEDLSNKTDQERQEVFRSNYIEDDFPMAQLPIELENHLKTVKYVLVGLNPGNAGVTIEDNKAFLNFHGKKKSLDYRLAAALYGTEVWGAFMTDLVHVDESDSRKVEGNQADVDRLEQHLDELGISTDAVLIALGGKTHKILDNAVTKRRVTTIPHYSGANGHWSAEKTHQLVKELVEKY